MTMAYTYRPGSSPGSIQRRWQYAKQKCVVSNTSSATCISDCDGMHFASLSSRTPLGRRWQIHLSLLTDCSLVSSSGICLFCRERESSLPNRRGEGVCGFFVCRMGRQRGRLSETSDRPPLWYNCQAEKGGNSISGTGAGSLRRRVGSTCVVAALSSTSPLFPAPKGPLYDHLPPCGYWSVVWIVVI